MLKPALARGELHCVGATTLDEYRKYIEKDAALERRFQKVLVDEPSVEDTIAILRGLKERYEVHHKVDITDPAIVAAATLSHRYIADRQLPDKAIDLIDEAAARIRMEIDSKPEALDRLERRIIQLKIEQEALKKENDEASRKRLADARGDARRARARIRRPGGGLEVREGLAAGRRPRSARSSSACASSSTPHGAPATSGAWRSCSTAASRSWRSASPRRIAAEQKETPQPGAQQGHRGGDRRGRLQVDRHSGLQDARGREGEAAAHGGGAREARRRPGGGGAHRRRMPSAARAPAFPIRAARTARSCSWAPPASARPSCARRSPNFCSTPRSR